MTTYYLAEEPFWSIQGEGLRTGSPTIFLRLAGCNADHTFQCWDWCDSKFARSQEGSLKYSVDTICALCTRLPAVRWVCITGGEPLLQGLHALCSCLKNCGYKVQVETNGTIEPPQHLRVDHWTVSPKTPLIRSTLYRAAAEFKFVIAQLADLDHVRRYVTNRLTFETEIFLQPQNNEPEAIALCLEALREHPDWRLSLQIHKLIGVP